MIITHCMIQYVKCPKYYSKCKPFYSINLSASNPSQWYKVCRAQSSQNMRAQEQNREHWACSKIRPEHRGEFPDISPSIHLYVVPTSHSWSHWSLLTFISAISGVIFALSDLSDLRSAHPDLESVLQASGQPSIPHISPPDPKSPHQASKQPSSP